MSVLESQDLTPDASARPPLSPPRERRSSGLSHLLNLTSPLTRSKTPEPQPTPTEFADPKIPTYGETISSPGTLAEGGGMNVLVGWDTTKDATLAFEHVLNKMSFAPSDHIFLCTVLPTLSSSSSASILNPFAASGPRSPTVGTYTPTSHGSSVDGPQGHHSGVSTPDDDESKREKDLRILKEIRATAMDRLKEEAMKLKSKGCAITPVIIHSEQPAKALCQLGETHSIDLIVLGRRKLSKLHRVVGAGSVGNHCLAQGEWNVLIVQK